MSILYLLHSLVLEQEHTDASQLPQFHNHRENAQDKEWQFQIHRPGPLLSLHIDAWLFRLSGIHQCIHWDKSTRIQNGMT